MVANPDVFEITTSKGINIYQQKKLLHFERHAYKAYVSNGETQRYFLLLHRMSLLAFDTAL